MRSGTVPHVLAVGLGAACEVAQEEMEVNFYNLFGSKLKCRRNSPYCLQADGGRDIYVRKCKLYLAEDTEWSC